MPIETLDDAVFGQTFGDQTFANTVDPTALTGVQRTLDDLGDPLSDVTFCVVDLETTGGSAKDCYITEIGAVKLRGGQCLGTFQTMVNPGAAIPPRITVLTGITESMVRTAPRIEAVLPALLEFIGGAVVVGHNVRFDLSFLNAALERDRRPKLVNRTVDTVALARRLVRSEVPNCKLGTLASRFRLDHQPSHRALDDALATGDLLHLLLERAASHGVHGLDDLLSLPTMAGHAEAAKLKLTDKLPRSPGVYLFRDRRGDVLYVGKAANLRSRVRSYFSSDDRRKIGAMLRELHAIEHVVCHHQLESAVIEQRLITEHQPRYNRQGKKRGTRQPWVKLTLDEAFPRLSIVRTVKDDGGFYLGPLGSKRSAQLVVDAIHTALPLRRCRQRLKRPRRGASAADPSESEIGACSAAQLGVAACPCSGATSAAQYQAIVDHAVQALTSRPSLMFDTLTDRMQRLAQAERFEEAADLRDRAAALAQVLRRRQRIQQLVEAGEIRITFANGAGSDIVAGRLVSSWGPDGQAGLMASGADAPSTDTSEVLCVAQWLDRGTSGCVLNHVSEVWQSALPALPSFGVRRTTR